MKYRNGSGVRVKSRQGNPLSISRIGAGIGAGVVVLLALGSCGSVAPDEVDGRPAAAIFHDFVDTAGAAVEASDTTGWRYADGSPWNADAPDIVFNPKPCQVTGPGSEQRTMEFRLLGPVLPDPRAARDNMQAYLEGLEDQGYFLSISEDPLASAAKNTYVVGARRADGAYIGFGANDAEQHLDFGSECSAHPSLEDEVSAQTQ